MRRHFLLVTSNLWLEHHVLLRPCADLLAGRRMMEHALRQHVATTTGKLSSMSSGYEDEIGYLLYPKET